MKKPIRVLTRRSKEVRRKVRDKKNNSRTTPPTQDSYKIPIKFTNSIINQEILHRKNKVEHQAQGNKG